MITRAAGRRPRAGEAREAGRADETIVLVTDRAEASLRWADNSMTTNGVSASRSTTVISIVRQGDTRTSARCSPARSTRR